MSDRQDTNNTRLPKAAGGSAVLETTADLFGSLMRLVFRASASPALLLKYFPDNELVGSVRTVARTAAVFPRAVAQAISDVSDEIEGLDGAAPRQPTTEVPPPFVQVHRQNKAETAILFIHGFGFNS